MDHLARESYTRYILTPKTVIKKCHRKQPTQPALFVKQGNKGLLLLKEKERKKEKWKKERKGEMSQKIGVATKENSMEFP